MSVPRCLGCAQQLHLTGAELRCPDCVRSGRAGLLSPALLADNGIRTLIADHNLGALFRAVREDLDINQATLGDLLDVPQSKISATETGAKSSFRPPTQTRVLVRLGVPPDLLGFSSPAANIVDGGREEASDVRDHRPKPAAVRSTPGDIAVTGRRTVLHGGVAAAAALVTAPLSGPTGSVPVPRPGQDAGPSWATAIDAAVWHPGAAMRAALAASQGRLVSLRDVRDGVAIATTQSLRSEFHELGLALPRLIGLGEALAAGAAARRDPRRALAMVSDTYALAGWTAIKAGRAGTALLAAERSLQAADEGADHLRMAAAERCLAEVHMSKGDYELAMDTAIRSTERLAAVPSEHADLATGLRAAALLTAAAAAGRGGDARTGYSCLRAARACVTGMVAERSVLSNVSGPGNLAIHEVAVREELGEHRAAAEYVPYLRLDRLPAELAERRGRALIDVARVQIELGDEVAALTAVLEAEQHAPEEVRHHRHTLTLSRQLAPHEQAGSGLREFVGRCGWTMDQLTA